MDRVDVVVPEVPGARQRQAAALGVLVPPDHVVGPEIPDFAAAHVDGVRAGRAGDDVRVERQQPEIVALLDRQRLEVLVVDRPGDFGGGRLHDRGAAGDRDGLLDVGQLHREVEHDALAGVEREVGADLGREAGDVELQPVFALRRERREHVPPVLVGGGRARQSRGHVLDRDGHAGQDGLLGVEHDAFDFERGFLCERRPLGEECNGEKTEDSAEGCPVGPGHETPPLIAFVAATNDGC